jgi:hypothetical protein
VLGTKLLGSVVNLAPELFRELVGVGDDPVPEGLSAFVWRHGVELLGAQDLSLVGHVMTLPGG